MYSTGTGTEPKRLAVRHEGSASLGNGSYLPSHRTQLGAHINKDRLTARADPPARWTSTWVIRIPGGSNRGIRLLLPIPSSVAAVVRRHAGRKRTAAVALIVVLLLVFNVAGMFNRVIDRHEKGFDWNEAIPNGVTKEDTCIFSIDELRTVYEWEVESGNYPTRRRIPAQIGIPRDLMNPSVPPLYANTPVPGPERDNATQGIGPSRTYIAPESVRPNVAFPPRPVRGSIIDLDIVHSFCDYSAGKYVRDCLEVMRVGAGLDNGNRLRRGPLDTWKYIYTENADALAVPAHTPGWVNDPAAAHPLRKTGSQLLNARAQPKMRAAAATGVDCDAERPRIFHMYWSGPFTDKPYMTLLSFLYTQSLGLHAAVDAPPACAPQFWVWINPGAGGSVPNPGATRAMFDGLAANPWAAPFLHERFHAAVKFKLWNTTAQLDAHAELAGWRAHAVLGKLVPDPAALAALRDAAAGGGAAGEAALVQLRASDKAQVIMSDLVRFVVTHAYGGAYVDVDHVLLRDWEELWGWRGAFAMRWSHHPAYNTAVLRMHAGSPLGAFFLRTALAGARREPFHPFDISDYLDDAALAPLLVRIPDALFDPNFLNMEGLQRERPPFPAYSWTSGFEEFFATPARTGAEGSAAGFDAFFRGAFAYHWHNKWEMPVDLGRNFPDLGSRFAAGERAAREAHVASRISKRPAGSGAAAPTDTRAPEWADTPENDERDLAWSAVLKRTFEAYVRGDAPNMYGEWIAWEDE